MTVNGSLTMSLVAVAGYYFQLVPACYGLSLGVGSVMVVPGRVVFGLEGDCPGLYGSPACLAPRRFVGGNQDAGEVLPSVDGDPRGLWNAVLHPGVSGIATGVMLFHQYGGRLVHRYPIYKDPLPSCVPVPSVM